LDIVHYIRLHTTFIVLWDLVIILKDFTFIFFFFFVYERWWHLESKCGLLKKVLACRSPTGGRKDGHSVELEPTFLSIRRKKTECVTSACSGQVHDSILVTVRSPYGTSIPLPLSDRILYIYSTNILTEFCKTCCTSRFWHVCVLPLAFWF
jgi:hypothetical protein